MAHRFSADEESAISLCRTSYEGDCRCERNGRVICEPMLREIEAQRPFLNAMRAAFAGGYPEQETGNG